MEAHFPASARRWRCALSFAVVLVGLGMLVGTLALTFLLKDQWQQEPAGTALGDYGTTIVSVIQVGPRQDGGRMAVGTR